MPDKKKAAATEPALNAVAVARFRKMSLRMTGEIFRLLSPIGPCYHGTHAQRRVPEGEV